MYSNVQKKIIHFIFYIMFLNYATCIQCNQEKKLDIDVEVLSETNCKVNFFDWKNILLNMLQGVFFFDDFIYGGVVLVTVFKNNTNGMLPTIKITNILIHLIEERAYKYSVINLDELYRIYRKLEISLEENVCSYEFSIKIANYLKADYIIYGIAYGDSKVPHIQLQLILSSTGEILCVVNDFIQKSS